MSEADEREAQVEAVAGAYRARDVHGSVCSHPVWHDLDAVGRAEAWALAAKLRAMEAALDAQGLSSTARAVLERIRKASEP